MNWMDLLRMSTSNLKRRKLRTGCLLYTSSPWRVACANLWPVRGNLRRVLVHGAGRDIESVPDLYPQDQASSLHSLYYICLLYTSFDRLDIHSGTVFNYHQERRKTKNYLADLELLQYDILYGKQYVYDGKPPITEGHMVMGIKMCRRDRSKPDRPYTGQGKSPEP